MKLKTLNNKNSDDVKNNVKDIEFYGNPDVWKLFSKASSEKEGWMKSTKILNVENGCLVQVSTQQLNPDGSYSLAEAITYVPGVHLDYNKKPRKLIRITTATKASLI